MAQNSISSFRLAKQALVESFKLLLPVLKRAWPPLLMLHFAQIMATVASERATELLFDLGREEMLLLALLALTQLVFTVMWTGAWLVILLTACRSVLQHSVKIPGENILPGTNAPAPLPAPLGFMDEMFQLYNHVMIEQVRVLASVMWRLPLLIVPAVVRYVRLSFAPYLVILDPQYSFGRIEALKTSASLSRGRFWLLFGFFVVSLSGPSLLETLFRNDQTAPWVSTLLASPFTLIVNLLLGIFMFSVFRKVTMIPSLEPLSSPAPTDSGLAGTEA